MHEINSPQRRMRRNLAVLNCDFLQPRHFSHNLLLAQLFVKTPRCDIEKPLSSQGIAYFDLVCSCICCQRLVLLKVTSKLPSRSQSELPRTHYGHKICRYTVSIEDILTSTCKHSGVKYTLCSVSSIFPLTFSDLFQTNADAGSVPPHCIDQNAEPV